MDFAWIHLLTWLDFLFIGFVLIGLVAGILRGALKEGYLLTGFILTFLMSLVLSLPLTRWVASYIVKLEAQYLLFFLVLFIPFYLILFWILNLMLKKDKENKIGLLARLIGAIFGMVKGVIVSFWFTWFLMLQPWIKAEWLYLEGHQFYYTMSEYLLFFSSYIQ